MIYYFSFLFPVCLLFCNVPEVHVQAVAPDGIADTSGNTIASRFAPPEGFVRQPVDSPSFASYLRALSLKPVGTQVYLYDGRLKDNQDAHAAVIDIDTGKRDLQQCADACMRLWAEFLWAEKRYDDIHFNLTNGFRTDYSKWRNGYRVMVKGNTTTWKKTKSPSNTYQTFREYLEFVYQYAGTLSLFNELPTVNAGQLHIGDIIIKGGSPGHAVMVLDMVVHAKTGEQRILLGQSYMPAQDMHVLKNPANADGSAWYVWPQGERLVTPEWVFSPVVVKTLQGF
jgi:Domain of unknown function (4846)